MSERVFHNYCFVDPDHLWVGDEGVTLEDVWDCVRAELLGGAYEAWKQDYRYTIYGWRGRQRNGERDLIVEAYATGCIGPMDDPQVRRRLRESYYRQDPTYADLRFRRRAFAKATRTISLEQRFVRHCLRKAGINNPFGYERIGRWIKFLGKEPVLYIPPAKLSQADREDIWNTLREMRPVAGLALKRSLRFRGDTDGLQDILRAYAMRQGLESVTAGISQ